MRPLYSLSVLGKFDGRVYQRVKPGLGNVPGIPKDNLQNRAYVIGTNPQTPGQQAHRAQFAIAAAQWQALDDAGKKHWRQVGSLRGITSYNAYISAYLRSL